MINPLAEQLNVDGFADAAEVGRGGFGVVYRCRQVDLDRVVAIKVLTIDLDENRPRFEREQRAMAKLTGHPNIVSVLQIGETRDGHPYLVMPYCRRGSVQTEISRLGRLSLADVLQLGVALAAGLESAHRLDILHRDIKPANVLLTDFGEPALTDFGLAHMAGGFRTATGLFTASPAFTASELARGGEPDRASDVYGVGATLFCALTGHPPFERRKGESVIAQILRVANDPVPDLAEYDVAEDVASVVNRALSRDPAARPTMVELGEAIQSLQAAHGQAVDAMALEGGKRSTSVSSESAWHVSARQTRGNLPAKLAGFVGRQAELAELGALISTSRLVTLTGVGGVGKTSLAVQAAGEHVSHFHDGVWLVDIGELSDGALLAGLAARMLGIRDQGARPLTEVLTDALAERDALVIFDGCEHVIDHAAQLIDTLLQGCPQLHILATSRELLGIGGEAVLALSPLPYPDAASVSSRSSVARYDAVALFVERARTARPGFTLTQRNAAAVARICERLDGLPLAIELAAARLRAMSVEQIADRLSDRFGLLTRGQRGAPTRQQTLSYCIDWSYDHCTPIQQQLWARLSVFAGSFDLDAAQYVAPQDMDADDLLDELCALVDKSILIRTEDDGAVRFRLLSTMREYGNSRIDAEQYQGLQQSHFDWCERLVTQAHLEWFSQKQVDWIHRLRSELPNIEEALQFGLEKAPESVLLMAAKLRNLFVASGKLQVGRLWVERALSTTTSAQPSGARIAALAALAMFAVLQTDWPTAQSCVAQAHEHGAAVPDPIAESLLGVARGLGALLQGQVEQVQTDAEQGLAAGDFELQVLGMWLMSLRHLAVGDPEPALRWAEKAHSVSESRVEVQMRTYSLSALAVSHLMLGDTGSAERSLREGLKLCQVIDDPWSGASYLEGLAWTAGANGNLRRAVVLMAAAAALSRSSGAGSTVIALVGSMHQQCERAAREELSDAVFEAARVEGESLSFDEAAAVALTEP
ncbi:protein kinase domain-containing protein [Mycobacterium marinum]|uniref:protein kinase domain-containing protein n=1 Tax=Mycobacterium marinum TaxID=1781 RepID=UPI0002F1C65D|nr:protein kinase [Mycobacterium marinum]